MHKLKIMSSKGHTLVEWALDAPAAIAEAERIFREHAATGASFFAHEGDGTHRRIDAFDPSLADVVVVPAMMGGGR